ncbi:MAG: ABC transporter substrate-binding protein [bacterium]
MRNRFRLMIWKLILLCGWIFQVEMLHSQAAVEIKFWHAMSGNRLRAVATLVQGFNHAHPGTKLVAQFTGSYAETMTKAISATRAGNPPHIIQVFEVGTQTMLDSRAFIPVFKLMQPGDIDWNDLLDPIRRHYSVKGKLYSMPFNCSTSILYYNKDLFRQAGLEPANPPATYAELEAAGAKIVASGAAPNALSFGWPAWVFEQTYSVNNQFYSDHANGRDGRATRLFIDNAFGVNVLQTWVDWSHEKILIYGGREYSANKAFLSGQVAMLIQSTSSVASIESAAKFEVGTAFFPRLAGYERGNSVIGGATLWVMKGMSDQQKEAVRKFLVWIRRTDVTKKWHQETGYFPLTKTAVAELKKEGWFDVHPNHYTALTQILSGRNTLPAHGVMLGNFVQIRDIVGSALEKAFAGAVTPKAALSQAAKEANRVLEEYNQLFR